MVWMTITSGLAVFYKHYVRADGQRAPTTQPQNVQPPAPTDTWEDVTTIPVELNRSRNNISEFAGDAFSNVVSELQLNPDYRVMIVGHIPPNEATRPYLEGAEVVKRLLLDKGIAESRTQIETVNASKDLAYTIDCRIQKKRERG
ncbi:MAG: hypothetical protein ABSB42_10205 [Tepidisphaeraceae bacterium]